MSETKIVIVGPERLIVSVARDVSAALKAVVLIGIGIIMDSGAMQWLGFLATVIIAIVKASSYRDDNTYSGDAAIQRVNELVKESRE